jgi:nucleoside-diphosphate-sugar epimerase
LLDQDLTVRCAVRLGSDVNGLKAFIGEEDWVRVQTEPVNLSRLDECLVLLADCDVVYHVAAGLRGCTSSLILNSAVPTRTLMTAAADAKCRRVVLVSSLGVYGPQDLPRRAILNEDCPIDAAPHLRDAYTYSKILQEEAAREIATQRELPLTVLRPGVVYGDERGVLTHRIGLPFGQWLLRMGGRQQIPLTYVENCAAAVAAAGLTPAIDGQTINIVDDDLPNGREIIRRYRRSGRKLRIIAIPQFAIGWLARFNESYSDWSGNHIPKVLTRHRVRAMWKSLRYSNERAKRLLNWRPEIDLNTAFQRTLSPKG